MNCFVCDKELALLSNVPDWPDGTIFQAHGNYGSGVWDPVGLGKIHHLEIVICDDCVRALAHRMVKVTTISREPTITRNPWKPEESDNADAS